ncbi:hypothetical protein Tco_0312047 [Tanacetum coccineum]
MEILSRRFFQIEPTWHMSVFTRTEGLYCGGGFPFQLSLQKKKTIALVIDEEEIHALQKLKMVVLVIFEEEEA